MALSLGRQTVAVTERVRAQHNAWVDGTSTTQKGCVLQPLSQSGETPVEGPNHQEGRNHEILKWALYAPAGFRASSSAVCTVTPGPTDADGVPLRLAFDGTPQPTWDDRGAEAYVYAVVRYST